MRAFKIIALVISGLLVTFLALLWVAQFFSVQPEGESVIWLERSDDGS